MEVVFLKQSDAVTACGVSQTVFQNRIKSTLKMELRDGKKLYGVPLEKMTANAREFYSGQTEEIEVEESIEDILGDISFTTPVPGIDGSADIQAARLEEIIARTKWINQKLDKKKQELYQEWSERFFFIFSREFSKFKNSLIDLRLEETQLSKLKENLEFAISNMEDSLTEIFNEYMKEDEQEDTDI